MESLAVFAKATTASLGAGPYINPPPHSRYSYILTTAPITQPLNLRAANPRHCTSILCTSSSPSTTAYKQDEEEKEVQRLLSTSGGGKGKGEQRMLQHSFKGNGVMTVHAYPSSCPHKEVWPLIETQLRERFGMLLDNPFTGKIKIQDFEWRVLKFNHKSVEGISQAVCISIDSHPDQHFEY